MCGGAFVFVVFFLFQSKKGGAEEGLLFYSEKFGDVCGGISFYFEFAGDFCGSFADFGWIF